MRYTELVDLLKEKISKGFTNNDGKLPSVSEIANIFSVSPMTAMKAVKALSEEGIVRSIRGKGIFLNLQVEFNKKCFGVVTMNYWKPGVISSVLYGGYTSPAIELLRASNCGIIRLDKSDISGSYEVIAQTLDKIDGLLITIGCLDDLTLPFLLKWEKPIVLIQHEVFSEFPFHQVIPDLESGFYDLACFLNDRKIESVLIVNNADFHVPRINAMVNCYDQIRTSGRFSYDVINVECRPEDTGRIAGQKLGEKINRSKKKYDAIFSPSDLLAFGIVDSMNRFNKKYGVDYNLVSYDNLEGEGYVPFSEPIITSVDKHASRISEVAAKLLLDNDSFGKDVIRLNKVKCNLVCRKSML